MPFSKKQQEYLMKATHRWNFKTGATRSGKTMLDYAVVIPKRIEKCTGDGLIFIVGNNKNSIERNVLSPMRDIWPGLVGTIQQNTGAVKIFGKKCIVMGADKVNQVARLQGAGIAYCYGDEVATWHREVFEMLKSRLDKDDSVFDGTCNPDHPGHWLKHFLDSDADIYHQTYQIDDNPFLSPEFVANLKKEYAGTVYYDRFILGRWVAAEGVIYRQFADATEAHTITQEPKTAFCIIGLDFGGNRSAHAANCTGYLPNLQGIVTLDEWYCDEELAPSQLEENVVAFVKRQIDAGRKVIEIRADSAEQVLIRGVSNALTKAGIGIPVYNAIKGGTNERIRFYCSMIGAGRYKVMAHCEHTIDAFQRALWDSKSLEDKRLDDGSTNIDSLDAQEYSTEPYQSQLLDMTKVGGTPVEF